MCSVFFGRMTFAYCLSIITACFEALLEQERVIVIGQQLFLPYVASLEDILPHIFL